MSLYVINPAHKIAKINREIYGHFAEHLGRGIYGGIYVGEGSPIKNVRGIRTDVVEALRRIQAPVIRWPGGCFADIYHWRDGIGPMADRPSRLNGAWSGTREDNSFGTHEFMDLCEQVGAQAYIGVNMGSGCVQEMMDWIEYMTCEEDTPLTRLRRQNGRDAAWQVAYAAIGNENWGCGGSMLPEQYAMAYRQFATYCRGAGKSKNLQRIACGPNAEDYNWTESLMKVLSVDPPFDATLVEGVSVHYYTTTGGFAYKGNATKFTDEEYYRLLARTLQMEELICRHGVIMDRYDPEKKLGMIIDEWGTWFETEPGDNPAYLFQQNTMRDAIVAAVNLNSFNKHADRVKMANLAQMVNVLQSIILTDGDKMVLTPTYHVFDLYKHHQEGTLIDSYIEPGSEGVGEFTVPMLHESVSLAPDGTLHLTICNLSLKNTAPVHTVVADRTVLSAAAQILRGTASAHNTFAAPETLAPTCFTAFTLADRALDFELPPCSVVHFALATQ